uniref:Uncharacterized protein n=1 Tax=Anopheles dirus TaxID=7168 RepID=A0A182NFP4_9DIPT
MAENSPLVQSQTGSKSHTLATRDYVELNTANTFRFRFPFCVNKSRKPTLINNLNNRKGSRTGNSGNHLEFQVLTQIQMQDRSSTMARQNQQSAYAKAPGGGNVKKSTGYSPTSQTKTAGSGNAGGSWGPHFKNRDHFVSMHFS